MIGTPITTTCATRYCGCGRCYSPGSLVGDWLRRHFVGSLAAAARTILRRPHRFEYDAQGGLRLPAWVPPMWEGEIVDEDRVR